MALNEDSIKAQLVECYLAYDPSTLAINPGEAIYIKELAITYRTAYQWLCHRIDPNYPIRPNKKIYRLTKTKGIAFEQLLNLIFQSVHQCETRLPPLPQPYLPDYGLDPSDPWWWFLNLLIEDMHHEIEQFRHADTTRYSRRGRKKDSVIATKRTYINKLSKLDNIDTLIPEAFINKITFYQYIEELHYVEPADIRKCTAQSWKAYIQALKDDLNYQHRSEYFAYGTIQDNQLIVNCGKGRATRIKQDRSAK